MKKLKNFLMASVIGVLSCIAFAGCGANREINLNDYLTVEFSGYDGYGEATVTFDQEAMKDDCEKIKISNSNVSALYANAADYYQDFCVFYSLSEKDNLSNGDSITLTWNCEDALASNNTSGTLVHTDMTFEVSGLKVAPTFDVFEGVSLEFEGAAPYAKATIVGGNENFAYTTTKDSSFAQPTVYNVKNGDTITIYAAQYFNSSMTMEEMVETYGGIPESMEKEFVVSGLDEYVTKVSDIPEEDWSAMDAEARDIIESYQDQVYGYSECEVNLVEKAVGIPELSDENKVCLIYTLSVPGENGFDFYWSAVFPEVIKKADGTMAYNLEEQEYPYGSYTLGVVFGDGFIKDNRFHVGYETIEEIQEKVGMNYGNWDIVSE